MQLYILRHGIAEDEKPGSKDADRALTAEGKKKLREVLRVAHRAGVAPKLIISSPYVRAKDTASLLANEFEMKDKVALSVNLIPPGNFESLINEIREKYDVDNLALVGHEPMLSSLISWLATGNTDMKVALKKGGFAYLATDNLYQDGRATLNWLLTPALLVNLSK